MRIAFAVYGDELLGVGDFDRLLDIYDESKELLVETRDPDVVWTTLFLDTPGAMTRQAFDFEGRERVRVYEIELDELQIAANQLRRS